MSELSASPDQPLTPANAQLSKSLQPRHVAMIAIGGIIGAGLFVGSSASIALVGPAVILSYTLAGVLILLVMRMLSEMAVANPGVQSFPEFARLGLGPWAGFMSGWLYWYFWVVVVAVEAIAGATIVQRWLPAFQVWQIGVVMMAGLTGVNLLSTRSYGEFEFWFSSTKVAAIVVFILVATAYAFGLTSGAGPSFANLTSHGGFMPHGPFSVLGGVTSVFFALSGAEIATIAAAESPDPGRTVARITGTVAVRILLFYVVSILLIVAIVPWTSIHPGVSPFTTALTAMHIPGAATIMSLIVLVAVLSCLNSGLYVTSRVLFTLAARGDAPQSLVALDRRRTPTRAILIGSAFSYVALAASVLSPQLVFSFLLNASGAIIIAVYLLVAAAQLSLRRRLEREAPDRLTVRMWLHPWASLGAIAAMVAVLIAMACTPSLASQFYASTLVCAVVGALYLTVRRARLRTRP